MPCRASPAGEWIPLVVPTARGERGEVPVDPPRPLRWGKGPGREALEKAKLRNRYIARFDLRDITGKRYRIGR
jgi:hypothetical protein